MVNVFSSWEQACFDVKVLELCVMVKQIQFLLFIGGEVDIVQYLFVFLGIIVFGDQGG